MGLFSVSSPYIPRRTNRVFHRLPSGIDRRSSKFSTVFSRAKSSLCRSVCTRAIALYRNPDRCSGGGGFFQRSDHSKIFIWNGRDSGRQLLYLSAGTGGCEGNIE